MLKVLFKGPVLSNSGYGVHSRQIFESLCERKNIDLYVQVTQFGNVSWILKNEDYQDIIEKILFYSKKKKINIKFDEFYQVGLPPEWEKIAKINIGITAGFEANIVKKSWINYVDLMDYVIVPSEFTKAAFVNTSKKMNKDINKKICVINESYYKQFDKKDIKETFNLEKYLEYEKNILIFGQITSYNNESDRKNMLKTINTALDFVENKKIGVVLKINIGKYTNLHKEEIINRINISFNKHKRRKLKLIFGNASISDLYSIYKCPKISCFLSGTRAEGWGLPFIESASCGLPIISTDYSSYKEFLEDDFLKIDFSLKVFKGDKNFIDDDENPVWAEFCKESMLKNLEEFFKNENKYKNISKRRQEIIKHKFNFNKIKEKYFYFFENL